MICQLAANLKIIYLH